MANKTPATLSDIRVHKIGSLYPTRPGTAIPSTFERGTNWRSRNPGDISSLHTDKIREWRHDWGAGLGVLLHGWIALDIDVDSLEVSQSLLDHVKAHHPFVFFRKSRKPRFAVLYRSEIPVKGKICISGVDPGIPSGARKKESKGLVEVLTHSIMVSGRHRKSAGESYQLFRIEDEAGRPPFVIQDQEDLNRLTSGLWFVLERCGIEQLSEIKGNLAVVGDSRIPDQSYLLCPKGQEKEFARIFETVNNTSDRDEWVKVAASLRAAYRDRSDLGFEIFYSWSRRWSGYDDEQDYDIRKLWESLTPPFRSGFQYLKSLVTPSMLQGLGARLSSALSERAEQTQSLWKSGYDFKSLRSGCYGEEDLPVCFSSLRPDVYATLRLSPNKSSWMYWVGTHWQEDTDKYINIEIKQFLRKVRSTVYHPMAFSDIEDEKKKVSAQKSVYTRLGRSSTREQLEKDLRKTAYPQVSPQDFDNVPNLLNTPSGVLNLETLDVAPHNPNFMMRCITECAPNMDEEPWEWLNFLRQITLDDQEYCDYLRVLAGSFLFGHNKAQQFYCVYGPRGRNGKGVFARALERAMGANYWSVMPIEIVLRTKDQPRLDYLASLFNKRLLTLSEVQNGAIWRDGMLKTLTGGDNLVTRKLYGELTTMNDPPFSFLLQCNFIPKSTDGSNSMRSRLIILPFDFCANDLSHNPKGVDQGLDAQFSDIKDKILGWMVKGAHEFAGRGFKLPDCRKVDEATDKYWMFDDILYQWVQQYTEITENLSECDNTESWLESFNMFRKMRGGKDMSLSTFVNQLLTVQANYSFNVDISKNMQSVVVGRRLT